MATVATERIHQASDLNARCRQILDEAKREGLARLRDSDGTSIVIQPERELQRWARTEYILGVARSFLPIEAAVAEERLPKGIELGAWGWLSVLDSSDLHEFVDELRGALSEALGSLDDVQLKDVLAAWHETALVLGDELSREVLLGQSDEADFAEVGGPEA